MGEGTKVVILVVLLGVLGYVSYKTFGPQPTMATASTTAANDLAACPRGTTACPHLCLKREAVGWKAMHVEGHPDTDIWMEFTNSNGHSVAYNQHHIGHVIELVNGKYIDTGVCPVCRGTTLVCK